MNLLVVLSNFKAEIFLRKLKRNGKTSRKINASFETILIYKEQIKEIFQTYL